MDLLEDAAIAEVRASEGAYSRERMQPFIFREPDLTITMQFMVSLAKNSCMHFLLPVFSNSISTW
jgi:hypothetical protein